MSCDKNYLTLLTLTGGYLVKSHWDASNQNSNSASFWRHRVLMVIEAVPVLGLLVSLIEIIVIEIKKCISRNVNRRQEQAQYSFRRMTFENPWEGVYMPLYQKLAKNNVEFSHDVARNMDKFLETHMIKYKNGEFVVESTPSSNEEIIKTFYALISLMYSVLDDDMKVKTVYQALLRPFVKKVPFEARRAYYDVCRAYRKQVTEKHSLTKDESIITLQRAFRAKFRAFSSSEPLCKYTLDISQNPPTAESNPIDRIKANKWIIRHPKEYRGFAKKIIDHIQHISFKKFMKVLKASVDSFNFYLKGLKDDQQEFVIVVPNKRSNLWVTELAMKSFQKRPVDIIMMDDLSQFLKDHPQVNQVATLDDAAYSGHQLSGYLGDINSTIQKVRGSTSESGTNIHVILPYGTRSGIRRIKDAGKNVKISHHQTMLSALELSQLGVFTDEEEKRLEELISVDQIDSDMVRLDTTTLTYFDHKIADYVSTVRPPLVGKHLYGGGSGPHFIKDVVPPYYRKKYQTF